MSRNPFPRGRKEGKARTFEITQKKRKFLVFDRLDLIEILNYNKTNNKNIRLYKRGDRLWTVCAAQNGWLPCQKCL